MTGQGGTATPAKRRRGRPSERAASIAAACARVVSLANDGRFEEAANALWEVCEASDSGATKAIKDAIVSLLESIRLSCSESVSGDLDDAFASAIFLLRRVLNPQRKRKQGKTDFDRERSKRRAVA